MTWYRFIIFFDILLGLSGISIRHDCNLTNPCMNLAKCDDQNGLKCVCSRGFSGSLCEIWPRECSSDFCLNQGTCVLSRQIPRCICADGFSGIFCEKGLMTSQAQTESTTTTIQAETSTLEVTWTTENITEPTEVNTTIVSTTEELTSTEAPSGQNLSQGSVKNGLLKNSICDYHPCLNKAECIALNDTEYKFYCVCPENYGGLLCENFLPKTTSVMKEKLSEISDMELLSEPETIDSEDWKSTKPNIFIITEKTNLNNPRKSFCAQMRPCDNNGQCVDLEPTVQDPRNFMCLCSKEYTGTFCHIKKNNPICSVNPCFNLGVCVPSSDRMSYTCDCLNGFSGQHCELKKA